MRIALLFHIVHDKFGPKLRNLLTFSPKNKCMNWPFFAFPKPQARGTKAGINANNADQHCNHAVTRIVYAFIFTPYRMKRTDSKP